MYNEILENPKVYCVEEPQLDLFSFTEENQLTDSFLIDYFGKSEPPLRQSEPPAKVGWICM